MQSPEDVRTQLHQQAQVSQSDTVTMYERWAAEERAAGNETLAVRYEERANRERVRPLPNVA